MELIIDNKIITESILLILSELRECSNGMLNNIVDKGSYISVTCPVHKNGMERNPSCSVFASYTDDKIVPGTWHCFTCDAKGQLYDLVSIVLGIPVDNAKKWLIERYASILIERENYLKPMEEPEVKYLDERILDNYRFIHPYITNRKITDDVVKKFKVGYNKETNSVTFPIWNINNKLVGITERCIDKKKFNIPAQVEKPVYLLNYVINENYPFVIICEAQIDALTCWSYNVPAVALLGVGSKDQFAILNKYHINWVTMFDNDEAGHKATERFNRLIRKDSMVINLYAPEGCKDINDMSKEQFDNLLNENGLKWRL